MSIVLKGYKTPGPNAVFIPLQFATLFTSPGPEKRQVKSWIRDVPSVVFLSRTLLIFIAMSSVVEQQLIGLNALFVPSPILGMTT